MMESYFRIHSSRAFVLRSTFWSPSHNNENKFSGVRNLLSSVLRQLERSEWPKTSLLGLAGPMSRSHLLPNSRSVGPQTDLWDRNRIIRSTRLREVLEPQNVGLIGSTKGLWVKKYRAHGPKKGLLCYGFWKKSCFLSRQNFLLSRILGLFVYSEMVMSLRWGTVFAPTAKKDSPIWKRRDRRKKEEL